jgi:ribulose-5-phosphate 4-epimerase/fuculose-1-phosphate aldolase
VNVRPPVATTAGALQREHAAARAELATLGSALGGLCWVQGPGGNCSVKVGSALWVKASGTRFAAVANHGGHVRVPLALVCVALEGDADAERELFACTPRPSLETYFHGFGPRVVAHTHALGVLLYACSTAPFLARLADRVVAIPYVRPGRGIARAMRDVLDFPEQAAESVCILRSHGVVAYAESAARAIELTMRCDEEARANAERSGRLPPIEPIVEAYLADDEHSLDGGVYRALPRREAREVDPPRYLFPDAPVCSSVVLAPRLDDPRRAAAYALAESTRACVLVDPYGERIAVARSSEQLSQCCAVAAAHDWLEDALRSRGCAHYLPVDEPARILNLPSEQYRMRLAARADRS